MTRINTNLSSLVGQNILSRNQASLQVNLTRLSTGLRINSGKDDPAGLIASEVLGRELTATNVSIKNTERANNIVATADAALKEVSSLLNDIRGLVQSAANKGATSSAEIASNQVQVDSALDTITRIAQTTVFGGDKLLNGAKGFSVSATGGSLGAFRSSADLTISSFDPSVHTSSAGDDVTIAVTAAATKKSVVFTGADAVLGNSATLADLSSSSTKASRTISGAALASIAGSGANTVTFNVTGNVGTTAVTVNIDAVQADSAVLRDAINAVTATTGVIAAGTGAGANVTVTSTTLGSSGIATISATSATSSTATTRTISGAALTALNGSGANTVTFDVTGSLGTASVTVNVDAVQADSSVLRDAINAQTATTGVSATGTGAGANVVLSATAVGPSGIATVSATAASFTTNAATTRTIGGGTDFSTLAGNVGETLTFSLTGNLGTATVSVLASALKADSSALTTAINAQTATTGVTAAGSGLNGTVTLTNGANGPGGITIGATGGTAVAGDQTIFTSNVSSGTTTLGTISDVTGFNNGVGSATAGSIADVTSFNSAVGSLTAGTNGTVSNQTTFEIIGDAGRSVVTISNDAVIANSSALVNAINAVTSQTGVTATSAGGAGANVTLTSQKYGSAAVVTVNAIAATNAADITTFNAGGTQASTAGTDAVGTVTTSKGSGAFTAIGERISYSDAAITFTGSTDPTLGNLTANIDVSGGALFQLGASVNFTNQVNINIPGLDLSTLGRNYASTGNKGLSALRSGSTDELSKADLTTAASLVEQAISEIATLRGRLGALQKNAFESNIRSLQSSVQEVTAAQSSIRDADFAAETAALTKNQILVQAGTSVLSIANSAPQAVLSLLPRG